VNESDATPRWAWVEVDLEAIRHNVEHLVATVAPSSLWAVVKAGGYGHGAVEVARAALEGGAQGLCVALVSEGVELRQAGIDAPILVLSEPPPDAADHIVRFRLMATVYTAPFVAALAVAARARGVNGVPVHLKIDTGMQRVGVQVDDAGSLTALLASEEPALRVVGVFTHLALADQPDDGFTDVQLDRFDHAIDELTLPPESSCTPRTRPERWRTLVPGARWCAPESRSTGSHQATRSTRCVVSSARRWR
jgi:alanine racemase